MKRIKLSVFVLIMLGAFSCKEKSPRKEIAPMVIEPTVSDEKTMDSGQKKVDVAKPIKMAKDCGQTFDAFFERFAKDSTFQKNRVKYPMKWFYYDNANYESLSKDIVGAKDDFRYFNFTTDKEAVNREYGAFKVEITKHKDSVIYKRIGLETGLLMNFKFYLIDGCWYLVEILDEST